MSQWREGLLLPERDARKERVQLMPPKASMRGMFFLSTVEIIRRRLGESAASGLLKVEDSETTYAGLRSYPLAEFMELQTRAAELLLVQVETFEEAIFVIGEACVDIFFESVAGRTMKLLAGSDPHRLMTAAPNGYGLAIQDGGTRAYERLSATQGRFMFEGDILGPCHQAGTFVAAIRGACGIVPEIAVEQTSPVNFALTVTWADASA